MKILLGSMNPSKKNAVSIALDKLGFSGYEIIGYDAPSNTHSRPIGYEIIRGAENRIEFLKNHVCSNDIKYDYLCAIEGGFSLDENGIPFVVTYCIMEDDTGKRTIGKSLGIELSDTMFKFIKKGGSLNTVISDILECKNAKQNLGIMGYLTNGLYNRENVDSDAVISSLIPFVYREKGELLDNYIKENFSVER